MLWVNLVMDTLGALALATEPPAFDILDRQPYNKNDPIVSKVMWRNVFGHAIIQIIILTYVLFAGQGWLCKDYSTKCLQYSPNDNTVCLQYNPYYADTLYQNSKTIQFWKDLNLTADKFNKTLLDDLTCD